MSVIPYEREPQAPTDARAARQAVPRPPPQREATAPHGADWNGGSSWSALGLIVLLHAAALWGLMQIASVREAVRQAAPIMVGLVTLAPPEPPHPEPPPPAPQQIKPKPKPQMIAAQTPAPAPMAAPTPDPVVVEEPPPPPLPPPPSEPVPEPPVIAPNFIAAYLDNPAPRYPETSRRLGESGTVTLRVHVNVQGRPDSVEVHKSCGYSRLDRAAVEAVRKWKFVPAKRGDVPIEAFVLVPLKFEL